MGVTAQTYDPNASYNTGEVVIYQGLYYYSVSTITAGSNPPGSGGKWLLCSSVATRDNLKGRVDKIFGQYAISNDAWVPQTGGEGGDDDFPNFNDYSIFKFPTSAVTIGTVADEKNDALYYLIWTVHLP